MRSRRRLGEAWWACGIAALLGCTGVSAAPAAPAAPAESAESAAAPAIATLVTTIEGADDELAVDPALDPAQDEWPFQRASAATATKPRKSLVVGSMDELTCFKQLKKLKIPHVKATGAPKIEQPIIVTGAIGGVHFDTGRPYKDRTIATGDAIDCRLAVSLHDLAKVVKKRGIATVIVKSFHRPNQAILDPNAPLRHRIGFAIDIAGFKTKKGQIWNVKDDFNGKIGQQTCGTSAALPDPDTKVARALWATFCEIGATGAFDSGISPNYNASHFDHVHFDLTTDHPILFFP